MTTKVTVLLGLIAISQAVQFLEGPSVKTKIIGPDGSLIDAYLPGGRIQLDGHVGPLLQGVPLVLAHQAIPVGAQYVEATTKRDIVDPGLPARVESRQFIPIAEVGEETTTLPVTTTELPETTTETAGIEDLSGAYVPDKTEQLFDDGSYKPEYQ